MAGLLELADTDDIFHVSSVKAVMPTMAARQVRTTRLFVLGIFSLIISLNRDELYVDLGCLRKCAQVAGI